MSKLQNKYNKLQCKCTLLTSREFTYLKNEYFSKYPLYFNEIMTLLSAMFTNMILI